MQLALPAFIHFLLFEISPVYISYGGTASFIQKVALARERIRAEDVLGFDAIGEGDEGKRKFQEATGQDLKTRAKCVKKGVKRAMWSINPRFRYSEGSTLCFAPLEKWGVPNFLGVFNYLSLAVMSVALIYWASMLLTQGISDWADPRYFVFTWRLEETTEYQYLTTFSIGLPAVLVFYAVIVMFMHSGVQGVYLLLKYSWVELTAVFGAANALSRAWTPPFHWQEPAFLNCQFIRGWQDFREHNDNFGKKVVHGVVQIACEGQKGPIRHVLANSEHWRRLLFARAPVPEDQAQASQRPLMHGHSGSSFATSPRELELLMPPQGAPRHPF